MVQNVARGILQVYNRVTSVNYNKLIVRTIRTVGTQFGISIGITQIYIPSLIIKFKCSIRIDLKYPLGNVRSFLCT